MTELEPLIEELKAVLHESSQILDRVDSDPLSELEVTSLMAAAQAVAVYVQVRAMRIAAEQARAAQQVDVN